MREKLPEAGRRGRGPRRAARGGTRRGRWGWLGRGWGHRGHMPGLGLRDGMLSLGGCAPGATVVVKRIPPELECGPRLRELGILEGASLTLLRRSNPVLVLVKESRIALDPATACAIEVAFEAAD